MDDQNAIVRKFFDLALEAERVHSECLEKPVEPAFAAVLNHVLAHLDQRVALSEAFLSLLQNTGSAPPELIQYCMYELRWNEVRERLSAWLEREPSERVRHILRKCIRSFDDDWYGAENYERFGKR